MIRAADATPVSLLWPEPRRHHTNVYIPWMVSDMQIPWLLLQHKKSLDCLNEEKYYLTKILLFITPFNIFFTVFPALSLKF